MKRPFINLLLLIVLVISSIFIPPIIDTNIVEAADGWVSPTGHIDTNSTWTNDEYSYDDNTATWAYGYIGTNSWGYYLEHTHASLHCDKVRFYASYSASNINNITLDVYYSAAWHNIYVGPYTHATWMEKSIGSTEVVTKARAKFYNDHDTTVITPQYFELEFYNIIVLPTVTTQAASSIEETTTTGNGNITVLGGENCDKVGIVYDLATQGLPGNVAPGASGYANYEESAGSFGTGAFAIGLTGLAPGTKYYARAYAHNSAGYDYGAEVNFVTKPNDPSNLADTDTTGTTISMNWTKGSGAEKTMVRYQLGSYPATVADGSQAYFGTSNTTTKTLLQPGYTYYFRAWSYKTDAPNSGYSDGYSQDTATTDTRPTVTTQAVSAIDYTTATGNGNIVDTGGDNCDKRGFAYGVSSEGTVAYRNPTQNGWDAYVQDTGNYGTGAFTKGLTGLGVGTTYYVRAYAHNSAGYTYGNEVSFTTLPGVPSITTIDATDISTVAAKLNGYVTDDGGQACDVRFQYNETFLPCNTTNATIWTTNTTWVNDTYTTGFYPYNVTSGLTNSTTYFFRTQIRNDNTTQSGNVLCFTTGSDIGEPTDLKAYPGSHDTELTWIKGNNTINTLVRAKVGSYPSNYTDGTEVYNSTSTNVIYEPLTPGITYYYRAWGEAGGNYTANYTETMATTYAGAGATSTPSDPDTPSTWWATPDYTNLANFTLYPVINDIADDYGVPNNTLWTFLSIILIMTIGIIIYAVSHQPAVAVIAVAVCMWIASVMGLMPLWIAFVYTVPAISIMLVARRT